MKLSCSRSLGDASVFLRSEPSICISVTDVFLREVGYINTHTVGLIKLMMIMMMTTTMMMMTTTTMHTHTRTQTYTYTHRHTRVQLIITRFMHAGVDSCK